MASPLAMQCKRRFQNIEHSHTLAASNFLHIRFNSIVFSDAVNVETTKSKLIGEMQMLGSCGGQATSSE